MNRNFTDFREKVVLITGASGGIGSAITNVFAESGAKLSLVSRSKNFGKMVSVKYRSLDFKPQVITADLLDENNIKKIVAFTLQHWGTIDILVNCAGTNIRKKLDKYTSNDWDQILDLNLKSVFLLSNLVSKVMKKNRSGKIINISSIQGIVCWKVGGKVLAPYCASKAGIISLTKSFALELAAYNINVNAVCPGVVEGRWAKNLMKNVRIYKELVSKTPLRRLATNTDVAGAVLFLASDAACFITGQSLAIDGGWTIE